MACCATARANSVREARVRLHSISQVDDFTATTSAGGQFSFVDLPGGGYQLSVVERRELGVLEFRAEFFNIFQHREFWTAFQHRAGQWLRNHQQDGRLVATNSILGEIDLLKLLWRTGARGAHGSLGSVILSATWAGDGGRSSVGRVCAAWAIHSQLQEFA